MILVKAYKTLVEKQCGNTRPQPLIPAEWSWEWIPGPPEETTSEFLTVLLPVVLPGLLFSTPNRPELFWVSRAGAIPVWPRAELILVWNGGKLDPNVPPTPDWEKPDGGTTQNIFYHGSSVCFYHFIALGSKVHTAKCMLELFISTVAGSSGKWLTKVALLL